MKILIAGDYSPRNRVSTLIEQGLSCDILTEIKQSISEVDYSIVNFETTVVEGDATPIVKYGPCLKCTPKAVSLLKEVGFNCVTLANNHFRDYGNEGVRNSLKYVRANNLDYVGGGNNIEEAQQTLYKKFEDGSIAIINACEHEFSIASSDRGGSSPLNPVRLFSQIQKARKEADYVLIIVHGGNELFQLPSPRLKELYRFFIDAGADALVNHHQHCYSGYEIYKGKPIVYGLGNFCFDHPDRREGIWNEGFMAVLDFSPSGIDVSTIPYTQCDEEPKVRLMKGEAKKKFEQNINSLNAIIADDSQLQKCMKEFIESRRKTVLGIFTPYLTWHFRAAAARHWIPYLLPKSKVLATIDYMSCESQRDITLGFLETFTGIEL